MDLRLDHVDPRETLHLYVNGRLAGALTVGVFEDRDTLEEYVRAARCLKHLAGWVRRLPGLLANLERCVDHAHPKVEQRYAACLRGLRDGLEGRTVPHPHGPPVPAIPPESSLSYSMGYTEGQAWHRCLMGIDQAASEEARP